MSGVDFAFDCIGVTDDGADLPRVHGVTRRHGPGADDGYDDQVMGGEKRFIGSLGGSGVPERDFPRFLAWHREGKLDLDSLVTARYALDEISEATQTLEAGRISGRAILEF